MASDDAVYGVLLVVSVPLGYLLRATGGATRELLGCLAGAVMACLVCGWHLVHFVVVMGVSIPLLLLVPRRYASKVTFAWCFGYLVFFRTCHYFGLPQPTGHSNAVQMLLTIKLVGLAGELGDTERLQQRHARAQSEHDREDAGQLLELRGLRRPVTVRRIVSYSLCYVGLLTGPFYKYRTYTDMLDGQPRKASWLKPLRSKALAALLCGAAYVCLSLLVQTSYATDEDFYRHSAWWRHGYLMMLFARYRARMYVAWLLSECVCVTAALGEYPVEQQSKSGLGPTIPAAVARKRSDLAGASVSQRIDGAEGEVDYETVRTIDPWTVETCATFKETLRAWNQTVQWWLAANVYSSVRVGSRAIRIGVVMLVSAFWHGMYPGYYATFLTLPFCLVAEELLSRATRSRMTSPAARKICHFAAAFLKMRYFEYVSTGPLLLTLDASWRYWKSTYFVGHACVAAAAFVGWCFVRSEGRREDVREGLAKAG